MREARLKLGRRSAGRKERMRERRRGRRVGKGYEGRRCEGKQWTDGNEEECKKEE